MTEILYGKPVAQKITLELAERADRLKQKGIVPVLAIVRVGENPGDMAYETGASNRSRKCGIEVRNLVFPETVTTQELTEAIRKINEDSSIHGCLMLRPLPKTVDERLVCEALAESKDIDGMTRNSLATVFSGKGEGFAPCTARACMEILKYYKEDVSGKNVVIIGRSLVIGKPLAMMMLAANATVTICHTKTVNLKEVCKKADILVTAAGKAKMTDRSFTNPDQTVLDVGINLDEEGSLCGDFDPGAENEEFVKAYTPVPGGIGSVTSAILCMHVIEAAEKI